MHRFLAERVALPLLFRRSWPKVRRAIDGLVDAEGRSAHETRALAERRAIDAARWAAARSPYLRSHLGGGAIDTIDDFRRLPRMTKAIVRDHVEEILVEGAVRATLQRGATGGSTGVPMPYYHDEAWWVRASATALRGDQWTGWRVGDVHATLWGTPLSESPRARWTRILGEKARNQLFLPSFDLSDGNVDANLARLASARPVLVTGYASVLVAHARRVRDRGVAMPAPRAVVSAAETLRPDMRAEIESAFGAPVYDRYGCRELGMMAQECAAHDGLHLASEHVFVEIDAGGRPARPGETGEVLVTLLGEPAFPFVRYATGDLAVAADDSDPCTCGLPFPKIARVEGRLLDVLRRADGGAVSGTFFPHLMKEFPFVREFQVFQDETGSVEVRVVAADGAPDAAAVEPIVQETRRILLGLTVTVHFVDALERTPSGKIPVTRSRWTGPARSVAAEARA